MPPQERMLMAGVAAKVAPAARPRVTARAGGTAKARVGAKVKPAAEAERTAAEGV